MPTWMITGCSSGLGLALAKAVLGRGWNLVATARNTSSLAELEHEHGNAVHSVQLDVTDTAQIKHAVQSAIERFGGIDTLVNNAGHGYRSAVEEGEPEEVSELFATNFFGPVELIKQVLPGMRARRAGAIINISSIAGRRSAAGSGYYSASKAALEGMSHGLLKEVGPLGIKVMVVQPGAFRTDFSGRSLKQSRAAIADYAATAGLRRKENDHSHGTQIGDPARGAAAIIEVIGAAEPPFRLALGSDCVKSSRDELQNQLKEVGDWEVVSSSTDFQTRP